jgi:ankyrin repeat protein
MSFLPHIFSQAASSPSILPVPALKPFDWAAFDDRLFWKGEEIAAELIEPGYDYSQPINTDKETPLEHAMSWGRWIAAARFIECGAPVGAGPDGSAPLASAAGAGKIDIARLLLKKGADPELGWKGGRTPLAAAAQGNHADIAALLLKKGAKIDSPAEDGRTPLMWAAAADGSGETLQALIDHGAALDAVDKEGNTPLLHAAMGPKEESVRKLIDAHAALDRRNLKGQTALFVAIQYIRGAGCASALLEAGADPNIADKKGVTPLMWAVAGGTTHQDNIPELLARGAKVDAQDDAGQTALMWAVANRNREAVAALLAAGANPCLRSKTGECPWDFATIIMQRNGDRLAPDPALAAALETAMRLRGETPQRRIAPQQNTAKPHGLQLKFSI